LEMHRILKDLRDSGKALIFSTHIMSEAEKLCDRIAIIHRGRILASDTLEGLRDRTGGHYLEDIFVHFVGASEEEISEAAAREEAAAAEDRGTGVEAQTGRDRGGRR